MSPEAEAGPTPIRVGTRGSALALAQSQAAAAALGKAAGRPVELVTVHSEGDRTSESLATLGGTGVFASALREALVAGEVDVLVHSLKDLPAAPYPGLRIGAVPRRADARDALCARDGLTLETLPEGARVGTGSPRRAAQLRRRRPDVEIVDIRGNVDTRLGRVGVDLDAVMLSAAGLGRLGRLADATELIGLGFWPTAPGQGALAIEVRGDQGDRALERGLRGIEHAESRLTVTAEREVLARLEAGCTAPIGAHAVVDAELLLVSATVYRPDGTEYRTASHGAHLEPGPAHERLDEARDVARRVAEELLANGAADLADFHLSSE
ncbi:hydroxymethylbilane synthase [Curtobacterium sp. MCBD17_040]|uniref:hydroxymethylbilane synthase n=1 Tax=Curtobacterium sp. MCBD17_040 TaxID=2175674 RepID=UPI000DA72C43|nr:hydroxymethylbilane synthase [Curtobacterium sp. MCBD17_040]WIB63671.1 hydroxymethylbilane synthase [Curtobacterium sp. MCBD17_040]